MEERGEPVFAEAEPAEKMNSVDFEMEVESREQGLDF